MSAHLDTIVACATPMARSAIAVLRLSGPQARSIAEALCPGGPRWQPRRASLREAAIDGRRLDSLLVTWMPGPKSYTGEDIVELSGHGNPVIIEQLLDALVSLGARLARPGEFTRRGLEHGRMDLLAAESLAGLIEARTVEGVRISHEGMSGALSEQVSALREAALDLAAETEARLDHPGEDLGTMADEALAERLRALAASAESQAGSWRGGRMALEGARVCLEGRVNVGKSSLFNRLLGTERALVSAQPGTTRDVVEKVGMIGGQEITWMDTAGLRPDPEPLEAAGMALAGRLAQGVDLHLVLLPLHEPPSISDAEILARTEGEARLIVGTHADLPRHADAPVVDHAVDNITAAGLPALTEAIADSLRGQTVSGAQAVLTSQRQHALLSSVSRHLADAATALLGPWGPAVAAEEIVHAVAELGELHGTDAREVVLDRLFSRFCIGK